MGGGTIKKLFWEDDLLPFRPTPSHNRQVLSQHRFLPRLTDGKERERECARGGGQTETGKRQRRRRQFTTSCLSPIKSMLLFLLLLLFEPNKSKSWRASVMQRSIVVQRARYIKRKTTTPNLLLPLFFVAFN